jgi:hypothetical protein
MIGALRVLRMPLVAASLLAGGAVSYVAAQPAGSPRPTSRPTTRPSTAIDERLVKKLLGGQTSVLDTVETTLAEMDRAAAALSDSLDPGRDTQRVQKRVLDGLDQLIEQARRNRGSGSPSQSTRRHAERRRSDPGQRRGDDRKKAADPGRGSKSDSAAAASDSGAGGGVRPSDKAELSRGWGFLPQRVREEIAQGFDEEFLGKYREEIIRYYRDLAKAAETSKKDQ